MIEIGHWIGQYKFDKEVHQKMSGFDSTNFEIEITKVDNNNFIGKVQDDLSTGGTEGVGEIIGKVSGEKIEFIKQMPIMTLLVGKDGTRKTLNKKHRKIYYQGIFSSDKKSIAGQWRFKFGFIWFGLIPIPIVPTKGTWAMTLKE
jgi:hypothetical protein